MRQRGLGEAVVSAIGCGDVWLAASAARGIDGRTVERSLHHALDVGISLIDVHEEEAAEAMVANAVRSLRLRDRVVVAYRIRLIPELPAGPRRDQLVDRLPASYVQDRVEATLRATRAEVLPLVQLPLHTTWRETRGWPELVGTCARLVREGKVLRWGAILDEGTVPAIVEEPWLAAIAIPYSLCDRAHQPLLAAAAARKLAVLARAPLGGGALTGMLGPGVKLAPNDDRRALDAATLERIAVIAATLAPLVRREPPAARSCDAARAVLERGRRPDHIECATVAELALRFVIDQGAIALPRMHRDEHLTEALAAAGASPLPAELVATLLDLVPVR